MRRSNLKGPVFWLMKTLEVETSHPLAMYVIAQQRPRYIVNILSCGRYIHRTIFFSTWRLSSGSSSLYWESRNGCHGNCDPTSERCIGPDCIRWWCPSVGGDRWKWTLHVRMRLVIVRGQSFINWPVIASLLQFRVYRMCVHPCL